MYIIEQIGSKILRQNIKQKFMKRDMVWCNNPRSSHYNKLVKLQEYLHF